MRFANRAIMLTAGRDWATAEGWNFTFGLFPRKPPRPGVRWSFAGGFTITVYPPVLKWISGCGAACSPSGKVTILRRFGGEMGVHRSERWTGMKPGCWIAGWRKPRMEIL